MVKTKVNKNRISSLVFSNIDDALKYSKLGYIFSKNQ